MRSLSQIIADANARRAADAERHASLNEDECMLCGARGPDKRTLKLRYGYAIEEVVPEAIDMRAVDGSDFYMLRTCKACRGSFLGKLEEWRDERLARRGMPMDSDGGDVWDNESDRNIPVRINGAIQMLTADEWALRSPSTDTGKEPEQ